MNSKNVNKWKYCYRTICAYYYNYRFLNAHHFSNIYDIHMSDNRILSDLKLNFNVKNTSTFMKMNDEKETQVDVLKIPIYIMFKGIF